MTEIPTPENPLRKELSPEDAVRMARLTEEVRGRLLEMGLILTRTLGLGVTSDPVPLFRPHAHRDATFAADAEAGDWMEVTQEGGNQVCYGVIDGKAFAQSPC